MLGVPAILQLPLFKDVQACQGRLGGVCNATVEGGTWAGPGAFGSAAGNHIVRHPGQLEPSDCQPGWILWAGADRDPEGANFAIGLFQTTADNEESSWTAATCELFPFLLSPLGGNSTKPRSPRALALCTQYNLTTWAAMVGAVGMVGIHCRYITSLTDRLNPLARCSPLSLYRCRVI